MGATRAGGSRSRSPSPGRGSPGSRGGGSSRGCWWRRGAVDTITSGLTLSIRRSSGFEPKSASPVRAIARPGGKRAKKKHSSPYVQVREPKLDAVDVPAHERDHPADVLERVLDDDLRRLGLQLGLERAGDCAVSLALFRGEDEDAATRLRRRVGRRFEHDGLAHGPDLLPKAGRRQPQRLFARLSAADLPETTASRWPG